MSIVYITQRLQGAVEKAVTGRREQLPVSGAISFFTC